MFFFICFSFYNIVSQQSNAAKSNNIWHCQSHTMQFPSHPLLWGMNLKEWGNRKGKIAKNWLVLMENSPKNDFNSVHPPLQLELCFLSCLVANLEENWLKLELMKNYHCNSENGNFN